MYHEAPTLAALTASNAKRPPDTWPYRVFIRKTGKVFAFRKFWPAARRTHANYGDVLYQHDGQRWRIWTSAGLF